MISGFPVLGIVSVIGSSSSFNSFRKVSVFCSVSGDNCTLSLDVLVARGLIKVKSTLGPVLLLRTNVGGELCRDAILPRACESSLFRACSEKF